MGSLAAQYVRTCTRTLLMQKGHMHTHSCLCVYKDICSCVYVYLYISAYMIIGICAIAYVRRVIRLVKYWSVEKVTQAVHNPNMNGSFNSLAVFGDISSVIEVGPRREGAIHWELVETASFILILLSVTVSAEPERPNHVKLQRVTNLCMPPRPPQKHRWFWRQHTYVYT